MESHKGYKIPAGTMIPTLLIGDHIIVNKLAYWNEKPLRGDIVVFKYPKDESKDFIKRIIGIEGDKIEIRNDTLYVNEEKIKTEFIAKYNDNNISDADRYEEYFGERKHLILDQYKMHENFGPVTVPENSIFVLGDNRDNSQDSRYWGFVSLDKVIGKALYIYWAQDKSRLGLQIQ